MNAYTSLPHEPLASRVPVQAISGLYRALAIAEAEWQVARERAMLDGLDTDEDDPDWEVYLRTELADLQ